MFERVIPIIGEEGLEKLFNKSICVFGLGGVGGFVCEALIRSGIKNIYVYDFDIVSSSNLNRQIIATKDSIGKKKVDLIKNRLLSINNDINIYTFDIFLNKNTILDIDFKKFDFIIDAIDNISAKICIIKKAHELGINIISCMGTGGKINPYLLKISDISKTNTCPMARVIRRELKKLNISIDVLYSEEKPIKTHNYVNGKNTPCSMIFVPSISGLLIARYVIFKLLER